MQINGWRKKIPTCSNWALAHCISTKLVIFIQLKQLQMVLFDEIDALKEDSLRYWIKIGSKDYKL